MDSKLSESCYSCLNSCNAIFDDDDDVENCSLLDKKMYNNWDRNIHK